MTKSITVLIAALSLGLFATSAIGAVPIMLGSGILHGYWEGIPAFSYWQSFLLVWAWGVLFARLTRSAEVT